MSRLHRQTQHSREQAALFTFVCTFQNTHNCGRFCRKTAPNSNKKEENMVACWKCAARETLTVAQHLLIVCYQTAGLSLSLCGVGARVEHRIKVKIPAWRTALSRWPLGAARGDCGTTCACQKSSLTVLFLDTILSSFFAIRTRSSSGVIAAFRRPWTATADKSSAKRRINGEVWIRGRSGVTHGALHSAQRRVLLRGPSWQARHMTTKYRPGRSQRGYQGESGAPSSQSDCYNREEEEKLSIFQTEHERFGGFVCVNRSDLCVKILNRVTV